MSPRRPRNVGGVATGAATSTDVGTRRRDDSGHLVSPLALDRERGHPTDVEAVGQRVDERRAREDLAPLRPIGETRRQVHGITHHRVRPSQGMADIGGEDHTDVAAGANIEPIGSDHDSFERDDEPLAVVADRGRHTGCDDHLEPVGRHVGTDQRHAERVRCLVDGGEQGVGRTFDLSGIAHQDGRAR